MGSPHEQLLAGLTEAQQAAVTSDADVLAVVAGAGSGKTTVLTRRIAWRVGTGSAAAEHVLVVTFTRKAAGELRQRLARLGTGGVWAGTFHAAAFAQLRRHWADQGRQPPALLAEPRRVLRQVLAEDARLPGEALEVVAAELAWAGARMVTPGDYPAAAEAARRRPGIPADVVAAVLDRYRTEKRRRKLVDLDDLIVECALLLESGGPAADALRWRFRHLFVDEFQDVNPAQWRLLGAWHHDRRDLCVVGDPRQAVYAWNGADPTLLGRIPTLLPGAVVLRLDENHRSSPHIVSAASAVLATAERTRTPGPGPGEEPPVAAGLVEGPPPTVSGFDDEPAEAAAVARWVRRARRPGHPWHHVAVLARTKARLEPMADALRRAGIPVRRAGSRQDAEAAEAVLHALRAADRRAPLRAALVEALAELSGPAAGAGRVDEAGSETSGQPGVDADVADLFVRLADEYAVDEPGPTVGGFLGWLAVNRGALDPASSGHDGVELATFHRAKGLEWPAVAVVGLEDGTVPIAYAVDGAARAEERRLFYVALTRAERELWCSWAARTGEGERSRERRPSPFLDAVRASAAASAPAGPEVAVARIAEMRSMLSASA